MSNTVPHPQLCTYNVDEVIETLSFGPQRDAIEKELMTLAPKAYERDRVPMGRIWYQLSVPTQLAINRALAAAYPELER